MQESGEMYLETIHKLKQESDCVHAIDISREMGVTKPSVSKALNKLVDSGHIKIKENGCLMLTAKGKQVAEMIYERHLLLSNVLERLGVSHETAVKDACRIEHYITPETFEAIKKHVEDKND